MTILFFSICVNVVSTDSNDTQIFHIKSRDSLLPKLGIYYYIMRVFVFFVAKTLEIINHKIKNVHKMASHKHLIWIGYDSGPGDRESVH